MRREVSILQGEQQIQLVLRAYLVAYGCKTGDFPTSARITTSEAMSPQAT